MARFNRCCTASEFLLAGQLQTWLDPILVNIATIAFFKPIYLLICREVELLGHNATTGQASTNAAGRTLCLRRWRRLSSGHPGRRSMPTAI